MIKAKQMLLSGGYTCVLHKNGSFITSTERGVAPLLDLLQKDESFEGYCAADKVVGKAAAFLYVLMGIKEVYACVLSKPALDVFENFNIKITFDSLCDYIENRQKNGRCPMESAVLDISDPSLALAAVKQKLATLKK